MLYLVIHITQKKNHISPIIRKQQVLADDGIGGEHLARGQAREPLEREPGQDLVGGNVDAVRAFGKIHVLLALAECLPHACRMLTA